VSDLRDWTPPEMVCNRALEGRYVRLERLEAARHGADLWAGFDGDASLWRWMSVGPFANEAGFFGWLAQAEAATDTLFYALCAPMGGACGITSYLRDTPAMGVIEIGNITYAPGLQGTPASTEATALLLAQAFAAGYRRVEWKCNARNLPSRRAAERLGFSFEGIFRRHMIVKGASRDTAWFAITEDEWPQIAAALETWLAPDNFDSQGRQKVRLGALTASARVSRDPDLQNEGL
jgi:RimJ/RimL family protein N-acetyltransferase